MIYSLCGKLSHVEDGMFVVECSGVGFACKASATAISCLPPEGSEVFVYTTMTFSAEQGTDLYGFYEKAEQECFSMLTGISGIGPKAAQRIILELHDKISGNSAAKGFSAPAVSVANIHGAAGEAIAAMVSLGYTNAEAAAVIAKLPQDLPVDEMIKRALKSLAMGR